MRESRTFTVLAVGALILAMAAMLAAPAQAQTPRGELEFKAPPSATRYQGSDGSHWASRSRAVGGAAATIVVAAALCVAATPRTKVVTA